MTRLNHESNGWRPTDCSQGTLYASIKKRFDSQSVLHLLFVSSITGSSRWIRISVSSLSLGEGLGRGVTPDSIRMRATATAVGRR
jgi:hypothetical protein